MHEFVEAFKFILHDGAIAGEPQLPSLAHLALRTLEVGAIGVAISALIAVPVGVWLGHVHRGGYRHDVLGARHREQAVHQPGQPGQLIERAGQLVPGGLGVGVGVRGEQVQPQPQRGQRGT